MSRSEKFDTHGDVDPQTWVGRSTEREAALTPELAGMLDAALMQDNTARRSIATGADMPFLWHWAAFPEFVPVSGRGTDGHPRLGGFLPALGFERRMWAGGELHFAGRLRIGEPIRRRSTIAAIKHKDGATGPMAFVTVQHNIEGRDSGAKITERQDIVYLDIPDVFSPPAKKPVPADPLFDETVMMNEVRLFQYSAATYNGHRIHYDLPYAREVEKYPALVVHGPMQATLALEAAIRHVGRSPKRFSYRGLHPMFHDQNLRLVGYRDSAEGAFGLATASPDGHLGLQAKMELNG